MYSFKKNKFFGKDKIISFLLGIIFSIVILELFLRLIGFVENYNKDSIHSKRESHFKILTLGNSYTAGDGGPEGQSYPAQLERMLSLEKNDHYKVINRGKSNVNSTYIMENLPTWLKTDRPQVVFVMTGEPNLWNKYGLSQFIDSYNPKQKAFITWDFLRWSKVFRFIELIVNDDVDFRITSKTKYSTYFKNIKLEEKNNAQLGYFWLGRLLVTSLKDYQELSQEQTDEAIKYLGYIFNKDENILAASTLAELFYIKKLDIKKFLLYNELAAKYSTHFNTTIYKGVYGKGKTITSAYLDRYNKILRSLENLSRDRPFQDVLDLSDNFYKREFKSVEEENNLLLEKYIHDPSDMKIGERLFYNKENSLKTFYAIEASLKINPLSPSTDLYKLLSEIAKIHPSLNTKVEKLLEDLSIILNDENFKKDFFTNEIQRAWIIHDLSKIINLIKDSGAKVVIQTYPPLRNNIDRIADTILRDWWKNLRIKTDIVFMDVGEMLCNKFNDGNQFYSQEYGPTDNHQNTLGNSEIAKLMLPYVLSLEKERTESNSSIK